MSCCSRTFSRKGDLQRHVAAKHDLPAGPRFNCPFRSCDPPSKCYTRRDKFKDHLEAKHVDIFPRLNLSVDAKGKERLIYLISLYQQLCERDGSLKWTRLVSSEDSRADLVKDIPGQDMDDILLLSSQCTAVTAPGSEFPCAECGKVMQKCSELRFVIHSWLTELPKRVNRKHLARHNRPFLCDVEGCARQAEGFATSNDLVRHKQTVHGPMDSSVPRHGWYCSFPDCKQATKKWLRRDNLKQHIKQLHNDAPVEDCICE
jgi:hypothetical protein